MSSELSLEASKSEDLHSDRTANQLRNRRKDQLKISNMRAVSESMERFGIGIEDLVNFFKSGEVEDDTSHRVNLHRKRRSSAKRQEEGRRKAVEVRRNGKQQQHLK